MVLIAGDSSSAAGRLLELAHASPQRIRISSAWAHALIHQLHLIQISLMCTARIKDELDIILDDVVGQVADVSVLRSWFHAMIIAMCHTL
jgi:hypothetical protein